MSFKIDVIEQVTGRVIRVQGRFSGEGVALLREACASQAGPLQLDLSQLRSADALGVEALRQIRSEGAALTGLSPYIELLLQGEGS